MSQNLSVIEQDAKYVTGTIVEITGQAVAAENGQFQVLEPFPVQPDGNQYFQWRRIGKNGQLLKSDSTANLRGGRFSWLEKNSKIVSTPAAKGFPVVDVMLAHIYGGVKLVYGKPRAAF